LVELGSIFFLIIPIYFFHAQFFLYRFFFLRLLFISFFLFFYIGLRGGFFNSVHSFVNNTQYNNMYIYLFIVVFFF
jgi:hypothetical protein